MVRTINCATVALALSVLASSVQALTYDPTKDSFFRSADTVEVRGAETTGRIRDINTAFYLSDFDRVAIEADIRNIISKPVGALTLADMAGVEFHWFVKPFSPSVQGQLDARFAPTTLQTDSGNVWTENNSSDDFVDVANSIPWKNLSNTNIASITNAWQQRWNQTGYSNGQDPVWGGNIANNPQPYRDWLIPDNIEFDYMTNPKAVGLAFIQDTTTSINFDVYGSGSGVGFAPYLVVQAAPVPEPASLALLGLGGALLLRRRRSA